MNVIKTYEHLYLVFSVQVSGPAPNLQVVSITPTTVSLTWEKPLTGDGVIQFYKIYYNEKGQDSEQVRLILNSCIKNDIPSVRFSEESILSPRTSML